jgi:hypothetical protein
MTTQPGGSIRLVYLWTNAMKKSLVAAGVIVALGVVWTGGAWYTGNSWKAALPIWCSRLMLSCKARRRLAWS